MTDKDMSTKIMNKLSTLLEPFIMQVETIQSSTFFEAWNEIMKSSSHLLAEVTQDGTP